VPVPVCDFDPSPKKVRNDDCYLEDSGGLNQSNSSTESHVLPSTSQVTTELVHQSSENCLDIAPVATSSPVQLLGIKFPVTLYSNKPTSFNPVWYQHYPWFEYSIRKDAYFCFPCHMLGSDGAMLRKFLRKLVFKTGSMRWVKMES